tara:strand:- start:548 stop:1144 length:597 start_codon:yes stop_codon:yes gene_type:complete
MNKTRKKRKGKGKGIRTQPSRLASTRPDVTMSDIAKKNKQTKQKTKKIEELKQTVVKKILNKQVSIQVKIDKPKFISLLRGELFRLFFTKTSSDTASSSEVLGLYHLFHNFAKDPRYQGITIPPLLFQENKHYKSMKQMVKDKISELQGNISDLESDLDTLDKLPSLLSSIKIPSIEDDISTLLGNFSLNDNSTAKSV